MTSLFQYPKARRDESIVEDHHGTKVRDLRIENILFSVNGNG